MPHLFGKRHKGIRRSTGAVVGDFFITLGLAAICAIMLYPFIYVLSAAISSPEAIRANSVVFGPVKPFSLEAYRLVFGDSRIWIGYANTLYYAVFGTALNLAVTVLAAYPLSRRRFRGRKVMNLFVSITMFISATGMMIPLFLVVKSLGLLDTRASLLLAFAASPFFIILMRSFFETIPEELFEVARLDGASEWTILLRVVLPMSGAALATIGLYYLINRWNGYFWAMVLITDPNKHPLQVVLRQLIVVAQMGEELDVSIDRAGTTAEAIKYATIVVSTLPIALIYPFLQKFFVKGITLGSIKG
ncbi:MAG: carbohydrate ABC transporter permease [Spirochaetes bacterium]|nr:carbohydrate ABC transporter permease [Spirochaetota bacterium]MBU0956338.1 carbohydrate ABC transporter permease [Spirochaetota bacterium]